MGEEWRRPLTPEEKREQERIFKEIRTIASDGITERRARRFMSGTIGKHKRKRREGEGEAMKPIYKPKGAAAEYAELALNIYTGCTHGCEYCYAPGVLRTDRESFMDARPRKGIVPAVEKQLEAGGYEGKTIHLCFTCDPYPSDMDHSVTRGVIEAIKEAGAHVQILTKNPIAAELDFDLLDANDWLGITLSGAPHSMEPFANTEFKRIRMLKSAHERGICTWVSFEPVIDPERVLQYIRDLDFVDMMKIGKLNHRRSSIDWAAFGIAAQELCERFGRSYVIKADLLKEMRRERIAR